MRYALIRSGVVVSRIVADANFISSIQSQYDHCIRVDQLDPEPGLGWLYDGVLFSPPEE